MEQCAHSRVGHMHFARGSRFEGEARGRASMIYANAFDESLLLLREEGSVEPLFSFVCTRQFAFLLLYSRQISLIMTQSRMILGGSTFWLQCSTRIIENRTSQKKLLVLEYFPRSPEVRYN